MRAPEPPGLGDGADDVTAPHDVTDDGLGARSLPDEVPALDDVTDNIPDARSLARSRA